MSNTLRRVTLPSGLLVCGLLACTVAPAADSERPALEAAIQRWMTAVNAQDAATLTATMTEDVELLDHTATATGRNAAIRALRELVKHGRLVATSREIRVASDLAWHVAGLVQTRQNGDVQSRGQALEVWKRVQGEWKLHRRMVTGSGVVEDLLTRPSSKEPVLDRPSE